MLQADQVGEASDKPRHIVEEFSKWLANEWYPGDANNALMLGRLIGLDKYPRVRPVGVGETWRQLMAKCVLKVTGQGGNEVCGTDELFGGICAGFEGGIHTMRLVWHHNVQKDDWVSLLIDA